MNGSDRTPTSAANPLNFALALMLAGGLIMPLAPARAVEIPRESLASPPAGLVHHDRLPGGAGKLMPEAAEDATQLPLDVSQDWWSAVQEDIRRSEYQVTWQESTYLGDVVAAYQAPNRAQNLRTTFTNEGVRVIPRTESAPAWEWGLELTGYGYQGAIQPVGAAEPSASGNQVAYQRQGLTEWYVNDERGLEQGFTVAARPPGQAPDGSTLQLELVLTGDLAAKLVDEGQAIEFGRAGELNRLRYADLYAHDATGRPLPTRMDLRPGPGGMGQVVLLVGDEHATYPVTVDPLVTSAPPWTAECDQGESRFGYSVGTAGDVNGDGYSDVIVGAFQGTNGESLEGRAFVYHGSAAGPSTTADWTAESDQATTYFGRSVGTAGDVNGDGYDDVIVGAYQYTNGESDEGRAFVFHGSSTGLSPTADWTAEGDQASAYFGRAVGTAGDVNDDGYADVIVGAYGYNNVEQDEGRAFVYHGSSTGLSPTADWTAESDQWYADFGHSVRTAGDVNGDGYADVIVGAPEYANGEHDEGRAYVYHGSPTGLDATAAWTAESDQIEAYLGWSVSTAGDVNGDGFGDVIVGALQYTNDEDDEGRAYVYHGSASGLSSTAAWMTEGDQLNALYGVSVGTAGDVNGDNYADVIVGAHQYDFNTDDEGRAYVYHGSASGLGTTAAWAPAGGQYGAAFGISVGTAGDVNGDSYADVIIGAYLHTSGQTDEGRAYVYYGHGTGPGSSAAWTGESDQGDALYGWSVGTAGDVNGDGYADVVVGALNYDNGQAEEGRAYVYHGSPNGLSSSAAWTAEGDQISANLGRSVGTAGDVNGDGYADLVVGAYRYDHPSENEGRVYVYHGSAAGLSSSANWVAESNQEGALYGISVGTAGDVNGDGYADLIVGASSYQNGQQGEGCAYVYHGSAAGLSIGAYWRLESNRENTSLGYSVGTAGDVNGDGYADIIIGAYGLDNGQTNEGGAYVFHGSGSGLGASWTWHGESNQEFAEYGYSVGTAGDVNGDGYADIVVGAWLHTNGEDDEGRAFVYHGSSSGLSTSAAWTVEGDQEDAYLGGAVGTAGDVNGDGYADIIIGARGYDNVQSNEGRTYVYLGGAGGLGGSPAWTAESERTGAYFGRSVGTAGDVNGDGYADVIIGAPYYDHVTEDWGRAYVFHGGAFGLEGSAGWNVESNSEFSSFGHSVGTAGDVNGDGYADVIVGAYSYDNGQDAEGRAYVFHGDGNGLSTSPAWSVESNLAGAKFGISVGTAGDVNGDGYADIIVGAYEYTNNHSKEGCAFVYHGSGGGLDTAAAWMAEGGLVNAKLGNAVGTAGDVNGDGYADVIVGAYESGSVYFREGLAYVYHGGGSGLDTSAAWTAAGGQASARFGNAVGTAGDVNGDGYADIIVGAYTHSNAQSTEGRAYVFHGGEGGLDASAAWTAESDQASAYLGDSVGTAGDVNGDGYADLVVGAYLYDNGEENEGRAWVYHGSPTGLSATAVWTAESNQAYAQLGRAVGTAGDVNGDGYADVVVGAYYYDSGEANEGLVYLFHGGPDGLSHGAAWRGEGDQGGAQFGRSVGTAGDVNGDGYADVIIGAPAFDNGLSNEGRATLFYGNGGKGRTVLAQMGQLGTWTPLQPWGLSETADGFELRLWATDPMGRGRVKLQTEVCPASKPFGDAGCITQTAQDWTDVTASAAGVSLAQTISGLMEGTLHRWRARVLFAPQAVTETGITPPPNPAHGPWRRFLGQALEADLRTKPAPDVALVKTVAPSLAAPGQNITYTLSFSNAGSMLATGVVITDTIPATVINTSVSSTGAVITQISPDYVWQVQDLATGQGGVITITGQVDPQASGVFSLTNQASINATGDANPGGNTSIVYSTVDAEPPSVLVHSPAKAAMDVQVSAPLVITFSEAIDTAAFAYTISPDPGGWIQTWSAGDTVVTLSHADFSSETFYDVQLTAAEDLAGNPLSGAPVRWQFTTADAAAPEILSVSPAEGETDVPITAPLVITFSETINRVTFACSVTPDPGGWGNTWWSGDTEVRITHADFTKETVYSVTVTAADDLAGNPLFGAPVEWQFSTVPTDYRIYLPLVLRGH